MGVGRGMGVRHPLVKVGARAKIVIFLARVGTEYVHPLGTVSYNFKVTSSVTKVM
jgi:hypothetical protein